MSETDMGRDVVRLDNVTKIYGKGSAAVHALRGVTVANQLKAIGDR